METIRKFSKKWAVKEAVIYVMVWCMLFNVPLALATPANPTVVSGSAGVTVGNTTTVTMNSAKAIINWNSLDTSQGQLLEFIRSGGANFAVLNRVISGGATQFNGILQGNQGNIFIINQKGIVFGPTAFINARTFAASSLDIRNDDFLNGVYKFAGGDGAVINKGTITADGVALVGKMVQNTGTITTASGGYVAMVAGDKVLLGEPGGSIVVEADGVASADIIHTGAEGAGDVTAGDVVNSGTINSPSGQVILAAGDLFSAALSLDTKAVKVDDGTGRVGQFGTINTDGTSGSGGNITLTAGNVVALGSESMTTANAGTNGNGGTVIADSPDTALFRRGATVEAKGGSQSGNGGFFELSGKGYVETSGNIDLTATNGKNGMFLIDPLNLTIVAGTGSTNVGESGGIWQPTGTSSTLGINTLEGYLSSGNVTLSTLETVGPEDGDIIFDAGRYLTSGSNNSLFVKAADDIKFKAHNGISFTGNGGVELYAGPQGSVTFVDRGKTPPNIATSGGDIIIEAGSGGINLGVLQSGASSTSGRAGEIRLRTTNEAGGIAPDGEYDIAVQHLDVAGKRYGSVYVNSAGNLTISGTTSLGGAVQVKTVTTSVGEDALSYICLGAEKNLTICGDVLAEAQGTRASVASVWLGAGTNTQEGGYSGKVTVNGNIQADASASGSLMSDATIRVYGSAINLKGNKPAEALGQGPVTYKSTTTGYVDSSDAVYVDKDGNPIQNPDPMVDKLGSGSRALVEVNLEKDSTCLDCANRIRVLLPVAVDDTWTDFKNLAVVLDVVANDQDGASNLLINGVVDPTSLPSTSINGGTLTIDSNGNVIYTPPADWSSNFDSSGQYHDSFTYKVMDSTGNVSENVATVTITLVNQVPVAYDNSYDSGHNVALTIGSTTGTINGTLNSAIQDYDPDNQIAGRLFDDTLSVQPLTDQLTANGGLITLNADGSFSYTPSASNTTGADSFTYTLVDGFGGSSSATVTLTLGNQAPIAYDNGYNSGHNVALTVDSSTGTINGTLNGALQDYDPDNQVAGKLFDDTLSVQPLTDQVTANGGLITLNADGSFTYTPSSGNATGTDSFTYTLVDNLGASSTATVTLTLGNQAPVAYDNSYDSGHNVALTVDSSTGTITGTLNGALQDYDPDNQVAGKLFDDTLSVQPLTDQVTANGGLVTLNADGSFSYTPSASNTTGTDSFTYTLVDNLGASSTATVTLSLCNQAPVAYDNTYNSSHNVALTVDSSTGTITGTLNGALQDYDPDNQVAGKLFDDTLSVQPLTDQVTANGGLVTLNADGSFAYTPSADNKTGTDSFTYTLLDNSGASSTATVTLSLSNQAPVAYDNSYDSPHNVALAVDSATGTITGTLNGAVQDYDPDNQAAGKLFDDTLNVQTVTNQLTVNGGHVTINADGSFTYTPSTDNKTGADSFSYTLVDDFGGSSSATVNVYLSNQAPVAQPDLYSTNQNVILNVGSPLDVITGVIPVENGDYDPDNQIQGHLFDDQLTSFLPGGLTTGTTSMGGTITLNPDGTFTYTPPAGFSGTDSFNYYVTDGFPESSSRQTLVTLNVIPNEIPPTQLPATNFFKINKVATGGCPTLLAWVAGEVGSTSDQIQMYIAGTSDYAASVHACDTCAKLKDAAAVLADADGVRIAALARVVNDAVTTPGPITEEQMAVIASNFADHAGDGTYYAQAGEWIDALAAYVGILNKDLRYSPDQSLAVANKYYGPQLESNNPELAAYVAARIAAIGSAAK